MLGEWTVNYKTYQMIEQRRRDVAEDGEEEEEDADDQEEASIRARTSADH